ncbi:hypothetical protein GS539_18025 [Rhodococcus hoagii]|nr:hypothetical protein [Prescottella equi]
MRSTGSHARVVFETQIVYTEESGADPTLTPPRPPSSKCSRAASPAPG